MSKNEKVTSIFKRKLSFTGECISIKLYIYINTTQLINFMRFFCFISVILGIFYSALLFADSRLKIGLVLSGGGAKGAAHIGVLKVIEQKNIPIDYIVGTSIGAYIGGLYALDYSVADIEKIMLNLPWNKGFSDNIPRTLLSFENKELRDLYNIPFDLGLSGGQLKSPSGLLLGQSAGSLLKLSTDVVAKFESFDHLAIPYRAIASDLVTAKTFVISKGSLTKAMRASAAVPGAIEPVNIDGKLLVDGGISNNMPIDVVKKMGADIVIAVDIGAPLLLKSEINSTFDVIGQLSTILTINTTKTQLDYLSPQDILIRPDIGALGTADFSIMDEALNLGSQAALNIEDRLEPLSVSEQEYLIYQQQKKQKSLTWFKPFTQPIIAIEYQNNSKVSYAVIKEKFALKVGDVVSKEMLNLAIERVYSINQFEHVDAEFIDSPEGRKLVLTTQAKSWGPNYLHFGFSLESDFSKGSIVDIDLAYILHDVTPYGGTWINNAQVGWETSLSSELYQPLDESQHYFSRARIEYSQDKWEATSDRTEVDNKYFLANAGLGFNYINDGAIEFGVIAETGELVLKGEGKTSFDYSSIGGYFSFDYDNLNSINFPTQGNKFSLDMFWRNDNYDEFEGIAPEDKSLEIRFDWRGAFHIKNHAFVGIASVATVESESDFSVHVTELGGFLNLSGYQKDELIGSHKLFTAFVYQYDLGEELFGKQSVPLYLGASIEAGNVWGLNASVKAEDVIKSGSLYLGTDTDFGPAVFGVGFASGGRSSVFLSLGKSF
jgi:NTE family protein